MSGFDKIQRTEKTPRVGLRGGGESKGKELHLLLQKGCESSQNVRDYAQAPLNCYNTLRLWLRM